MTPVLEEFEAPEMAPAELDACLAQGWRHFGRTFFRYNFALHEGALCGVLPLRVRLADFTPSKSERRILRRNADLTTVIRATEHREEYDTLFARHRVRFTESVPDSLRDFLSAAPATEPCENVAVEVRAGGTLVAVSFLDLGAESGSSVYAMFDPEWSARSPGVYTLLLEIAHAQALGRRYHYLGYAYTVPSVYDYKKRVPALEAYDWGHGWRGLPREFTWARRMDAR